MCTKRSYILKLLSAAGLLKYAWSFSGHQALKGQENYLGKMKSEKIFSTFCHKHYIYCSPHMYNHQSFKFKFHTNLYIYIYININIYIFIIYIIYIIYIYILWLLYIIYRERVDGIASCSS